jgi:hypothetical protein
MICISNTLSRKRDPNVVLPRDVKVTIKRGRAVYRNATRGKPSRSKKTLAPRAIISIIDLVDDTRREKRLEAKAKAAKGHRGQPPMTDRLRAVSIVVDHLERQGVPFATARSSRMNKQVRKWLNDRMCRTKDERKSRRGTIGDDAVSDLLKHVQELRK